MGHDDPRDAVYVAPVLPSDARNLARALDEAGRLRWLVTGYAYRSGGLLERCARAADLVLGGRLTRWLRRRTPEGVAPGRVRHRPAAVASHLLRRRLPRRGRATGSEDDRLFRTLDRFAAREVIDDRTGVVMAREDGALVAFRRAKDVGAVTVYDLPTAHHATWLRVVGQEEAAFPRVCTFPSVRSALTRPRTERKDRELALADWFVVGSAFVRDSLAERGYPADRVLVLPLACDESWAGAENEVAGGTAVLQVGRLSLAKGTHRLLRAWKRLGAYRTHRLRLVGDLYLTPRFLADFAGCYEHVPRLPRDELRAHYRAAGLLVMPSLVEGCAAVIPEALSCGVPVLASRNSGADGFLEHGRECLLHAAGDEDELCAHLDAVLSQPKRRVAMAQAARETARRWTWPAYRRQFVSLLAGTGRPVATVARGGV